MKVVLCVLSCLSLTGAALAAPSIPETPAATTDLTVLSEQEQAVAFLKRRGAKVHKSTGPTRTCWTVFLNYIDIDDSVFDKLAKLDDLDNLLICGSTITDDGLQSLKQFPDLRFLTLGKRTQFTTKALEHVCQLRHLQFLFLELPIDDEEIKQLRVLQDLQTLTLFSAKISDQGLQEVCRFPKLQNLQILNCKNITDAGLKHLTAAKSLTMLRLDGTPVTDAGVVELAKLESVRSLCLSKTMISDKAIDELIKMKSLRWLNIRETQVSEAGIARLQKALPNCKIHR